VTTLGSMIDEVLINLSGYTYQQDRSTYLTAAVTTLTSPSSSPTILSLGSTDSVGKGIIEVDEELMWITSFDRVSNTATIAPYGRGYLGTTAATHAVDAKVTISPIFPRYVVKRAINDTIRAMGTQLLIIGQTTFVFNPSVTTYELTDSNGSPLRLMFVAGHLIQRQQKELGVPELRQSPLVITLQLDVRLRLTMSPSHKSYQILQMSLQLPQDTPRLLVML